MSPEGCEIETYSVFFLNFVSWCLFGIGSSDDKNEKLSPEEIPRQGPRKYDILFNG